MNKENPAHTDPIRREIDAIYDQSVSGYDQSDSEREVHPASAKVHKIINRIQDARKYKLDTQFFTHEQIQGRFVDSVAKLLFGDASRKRIVPLTEDHLKIEESRIGGQIFGEVKPNERREFFYDQAKSWFFYQSLDEGSNNFRYVTLHYEVHPQGILRVSSDESTPNIFIEGEELTNFVNSAQIYHDRVMGELYPDYRASDNVIQLPLKEQKGQDELDIAA